ncbi:alpha/beta hydrolase [Tuwongella immobilis]|uniref:BD-FAE-like domain-containing protein n=1 Tax=Tuwongella immobilis TaxID=692036 RepID=A0A6C2YKV2_9BACT|nr:alpha/beta hydrolase [Tuwongella immobilis]VIP02208.1 endo- -beta-xylanase : Endo-1,4-beta-xylanase B OS=uncultured planctomycete GN=HGMM_F06C06C03 PE=4 SV=1: Abhydrolase_3 [Tuwongella immobilis]VTS00711.1 endo- -beta-xylanase : Endo-1,4-beta-xylanase B OS=uncultured planctomycete GN=HGMM_F06C06C03 PE=4 SV=1: Abhydrolase_3 [Tuwongella immobilis]
MLTSVCLMAALLAPAADAVAPVRPVHRLWAADAPGAKGTTPADIPTLTVYAPEKPNGTAVVVCPGGGYGGLAMDHEGKQIGEWLTARGVTAFVLVYRHAPKYAEPTPKLDVQRAIRWVRSHAKEYSVTESRVGVWGFSAGGHLASTAATHFDAGDPKADDLIDRQSSRPDFAILAYPVISMEDGQTHGGSKRNLLGMKPTPEKIKEYNNHQRVTANTPPTFLFHTTEDKAVLPINSILFYTACVEHKVPVELHIYEKGAHGVGLAQRDPVLRTWSDRLDAWLGTRGFLPKN